MKETAIAGPASEDQQTGNEIPSCPEYLHNADPRTTWSYGYRAATTRAQQAVERIKRLEEALKFYANGYHFHLHDESSAMSDKQIIRTIRAPIEENSR